MLGHGGGRDGGGGVVGVVEGFVAVVLTDGAREWFELMAVVCRRCGLRRSGTVREGQIDVVIFGLSSDTQAAGLDVGEDDPDQLAE